MAKWISPGSSSRDIAKRLRSGDSDEIEYQRRLRAVEQKMKKAGEKLKKWDDPYDMGKLFLNIEKEINAGKSRNGDRRSRLHAALDRVMDAKEEKPPQSGQGERATPGTVTGLTKKDYQEMYPEAVARMRKLGQETGDRTARLHRALDRVMDKCGYGKDADETEKETRAKFQAYLKANPNSPLHKYEPAKDSIYSLTARDQGFLQSILERATEAVRGGLGALAPTGDRR